MAGRMTSGPGSGEVAARLRELIRTGKIAPGEALPPLAQLQEDYGASFHVVRYAVRELATERLIEMRPGKGNYVTDPDEWAPNEVAEFMQQLVSLRDEVRELRTRMDSVERRLPQAAAEGRPPRPTPRRAAP